MMFTFLLLLLKINMSVQKIFRDRSASSALPRGRDHSRGHGCSFREVTCERAEDFYPPTLETTFIFFFLGKQIQG